MGIRLGDLHEAFAHAFHFAAVQHDARLDNVEDGVVVSGASIARQHGRFIVIFCHGSDLSLGSVMTCGIPALGVE
jgi:hypothetical protein